MHLFQFAEPIAGEEPADALRTLVFMANFAAQDITGSMDASRGVGELIDALAHPFPFHRTIVFGVTNDPVSGPLSSLDIPLVPSSGDAGAEPEALAWLIMVLPTLDNTHVAEASIVLDVDLLPIDGRVTDDATETIGFLLNSARRLASALGRTSIHLWHQHALTTTSDFDELFQSAGFSLAHSETDYALEPRKTAVAPGIEVFANENFPESLVEGVARIYELASVDTPRGTLDLDKQHWSPERLAQSTAHFRSLGTENFHAIALGSDGSPVAMSEVWVHDGFSPEVAVQGLTYVVLEHRGQGLGLAVKQAAITTALTVHPQLSRVYTSVSPDNTAMVELNNRLGATPVARTSVYRLQIDDGQ